MASQPTLWKETIWYNAMRTGGAGFLIGFLLIPEYGPFGPLLGPFAFMFMYPVIAAIIVPFSIFLGPVGLIAGAFGAIFFVSLGDPLVYALSKVKPEWVPVDRPSIFSLKLLIRVKAPAAEKRYAVVEILD